MRHNSSYNWEEILQVICNPIYGIEENIEYGEKNGRDADALKQLTLPLTRMLSFPPTAWLPHPPTPWA